MSFKNYSNSPTLIKVMGKYKVETIFSRHSVMLLSSLLSLHFMQRLNQNTCTSWNIQKSACDVHERPAWV